MAVPVDRQSFKDFCMRALGWPAISIELDDDNIEDRIDEALNMYGLYHFDGSSRLYYKHQVTLTDKTNGFITLPPNVLGVVQIFNPNSRMTSINNLFGIQYQLALNELYLFSSYSMIPYYMGMMHLNLIDEILNGVKPIRYQRNGQILNIDMDWNLFETNDYLLVEAHQVVDPNTYTSVWADIWLQRYATVLIKKNWGSVLKKFGKTMKLPSGIEFDGQTLYDEAENDRIVMEKELKTDWSRPPAIFIG